MKTRVLIPIDRTGLSELVPAAMSRQMRPEETEILIVQVIEPILFSVPAEMPAGFGPEVVERQKEEEMLAKRSLDAAVETLRQAGFKAESKLLETEVEEGILSAATEWGADLIILASHARMGIAKFLHASVAEAIVHRAPCAVLVLKEGELQAAA